MEMLETGIAFAIAMILFSSIVTGIAEAVLRFRGERARFVRTGVAQLVVEMREFHDDLFEASKKAGKTKEAFCAELVDELTLKRLAGPPIALRRGEGARRVESLSAHGFAMRLYDHPLGVVATFGNVETRARPLDENRLKHLWTDILRRYERYRALTVEDYRRFSQFYALIAAVVFAIAFNVDATRLVTHLSESAETRQFLRSQTALVIEDANEALDAIEQQIEGAADEDAATDGGAEGQQSLAQDVAALSRTLDPYRKDGMLPVGWRYYPYCKLPSLVDDTDEDTDDACLSTEDAALAISFFGVGAWALNAVVAGFLIGLGGPFWYRVFAGLSNLANLMRSVGGGSAPSEDLSPGTAQVVRRKSEEGDIEAEINAVVDAVAKRAALDHAVASARATPGPAEERAAGDP